MVTQGLESMVHTTGEEMDSSLSHVQNECNNHRENLNSALEFYFPLLVIATLSEHVTMITETENQFSKELIDTKTTFIKTFVFGLQPRPNGACDISKDHLTIYILLCYWILTYKSLDKGELYFFVNVYVHK